MIKQRASASYLKERDVQEMVPVPAVAAPELDYSFIYEKFSRLYQVCSEVTPRKITEEEVFDQLHRFKGDATTTYKHFKSR